MAIAELLLDCTITFLSLVGFLFNVYIVVSLLISKQLSRPANLLILHLSILFTVLTFLFLAMSTPTLLGTDSSKFLFGDVACTVYGLVHLVFHPLALWTIAGIHLDRLISIVNPLRYPSIMTKRKCALYLTTTWIANIIVCIFPMVGYPPMEFRPAMGLCSTVPPGTNPSFPVTYMTISLSAPLFIVTGVNIKITSIAKHHRFRIANALFGMTLGGAAQHMQTEGVRARNQQEKALKHFEGKNAVRTWMQLVGSLHFAYLPTVVLWLYETIANQRAPSLVIKVAVLCLMLSPPVNSFLFGVRNKSIQMVLLNFMRREFYKNEVQQEIRLRSPGLAASKRPSMTSIVGQITCQVPYLQRQVSSASLLTLNPDNSSRIGGGAAAIGSTSSAESTDREQRRRRLLTRPPMIRHSSDLLWRVSSLNASSNRLNPDGRHAKIKRTCSRQSLAVPESTRDILNFNEEPDEYQTSAAASTSKIQSKGKVGQRNLVSVVSSKYQQLHHKPNGLVMYSRQNNSSGGILASSSDEDVGKALAIVENGSLSEPESDNVFITTKSKRFKSSFRSTFNLSNAVKSMLQQQPLNSTERNRCKPKITITRVPTIDQTELGFLYPIADNGKATNEPLEMNATHKGTKAKESKSVSSIVRFTDSTEGIIETPEEPEPIPVLQPRVDSSTSIEDFDHPYFEDFTFVTSKEIFI